MQVSGFRSLIKRLPEYASDVKQNIQDLFNSRSEDLTKRQLHGIALTAGYYLQNEQLLNDIRMAAKMYLEEADATAAKSAVIITSMLSTYDHTASTVKWPTKPSGIHAEAYTKTSVPEVDLELYCFTASVLIGCNECIVHHINKLTKLGISEAAAQKIVKIASVLKAAKIALEIEGMRSYDFIASFPNIS